MHRFTLKTICLVKVAVILWRECYSLDQLVRACFYPPEYWFKMENKCKRNLTTRIPVTLIDEIKSFLKPVCVEIYKFLTYQKQILNKEPRVREFNRNYLEQLLILNLWCMQWTPHGTVDVKETTRALLVFQGGSIDLATCYKLSCESCLVDFIDTLWNRLPGFWKRVFLHSQIENFAYHESRIDIVTVWSLRMAHAHSHRVDGILKARELLDINEYAFTLAVKCENKVAVKYFWNELLCHRKKYLFFAAISSFKNKFLHSSYFLEEYHDDCYDFQNSYRSENIMFLLQNIDISLLQRCDKKTTTDLLRALLYWPCQNFFSDIIQFFNDVNDSKFKYAFSIISELFNKIKWNFKDHDYISLMQQLLKRRSVPEETHMVETLCNRFENPDNKNYISELKFKIRSI